jgi:hypothetical protein
MDDIATQCGMSKKTIYQYFTDKDELVDAAAECHIKDNKCMCETERKKAKDALHEVFLAMDMAKGMIDKLHPGILHDLEKYHPNTFNKFRKHKNEFMYKVVRDNLEWGIKDGIYRPEIDVDVITRFRLESMFLPFNLLLFPQGKYNITRIEEELMLHYVYGLATIKGHKLIEKYQKQRQSN